MTADTLVSPLGGAQEPESSWQTFLKGLSTFKQAGSKGDSDDDDDVLLPL